MTRAAFIEHHSVMPPPQIKAVRLFTYRSDEPNITISVSGIPTKETNDIQTVRVWMDNGFRHVVEIEKSKLISVEPLGL